MEFKTLGSPIAAIGKHQRAKFRASASALLRCLSMAGLLLAAPSHAALINSTWWTYQQDCNGDGAYAGQLPGNLARLNWTPVATNCSGNLNVHEIIYSQTCNSSNWTPLYTNAVHMINGCSINNSQYYDVQMASNNVCRNYKIEIYSKLQTPDNVESNTNDVNLSAHHEQLLSQDFCLSDYFATAASIAGRSGTRLDDSTYATKEPGEPNHAGNPGGKSLWYIWTATTNTPVTFDTVNSSYDTLLAAYTGTTLTNLSLIASNDDIAGASNRFSRITFTPVTGTTYHIAVDGFGGASGIAQLNWNQTGGALPDLIVWGPSANPSVFTNTFVSSDCEVVEGCEPVGVRTLLSFTTETRNIGPGDLVMGNPATNSLFHWAICHQHYHFEQFASYALLNTNVLDGQGNPTVVATGHKVGFCLEDVIQWSPTANASGLYNCTYQGIQAGWADIYYGNNYYPAPYNNGLPCQYIDITGVAPGNYVLQIIVNPDNVLPESNTNNNVTLVPVIIPAPGCSVTPTNDSFANAVVVTNLPFVYSELNQCGSLQTGEPKIGGATGGHSVWFKWTPTSNQNVTINTRGSSFDTLLGVYTGTQVSALTVVATNDDIIQGQMVQSQVTFAATAGTTYHISVDGWSGAIGTMVLNIQPPYNDSFSAPAVITGTSGTIAGHNYGGSKEPYEPSHAGDPGGHSLWYFWTAPTNGPVDFNTMGSTFDTTLAVYTGGSITATGALTNLVLITSCHRDPEAEGALGSRVDFIATAGTTYKIAIDGFGAVTGNTVLNWTMQSNLSITHLPDGTVQVSLTGVDWQRYSLLGSTDNTNWPTNIASITMQHGVHQYKAMNPATNGPGMLLYRGRLTGQ